MSRNPEPGRLPTRLRNGDPTARAALFRDVPLQAHKILARALLGGESAFERFQRIAIERTEKTLEGGIRIDDFTLGRDHQMGVRRCLERLAQEVESTDESRAHLS